MNLWKTIKSAIKKVIIIVSILYIMAIIWLVWEVLKDVIPFHKTNFRNYEAFYRKIRDNSFPGELPVTAEDPKYYFYSGHLDRMYGVSLYLGEEEFQELKQFYFSKYDEERKKNETHKECTFLLHEKLTDQFIQDENMIFVKELMREEADNYSILAFEKIDGTPDNIHRSGVFLNELTREFIIINFRDVLPQDLRRQTEEPSTESME